MLALNIYADHDGDGKTVRYEDHWADGHYDDPNEALLAARKALLDDDIMKVEIVKLAGGE